MRSLKKTAVAATIVVGLASVGVAFAAWTTNGTGSGSAKATSSIALTTVDAAASTTAQLYPGGSGDLKITIQNDNAYPVRVTNINNGAGSITSDKGPACNNSTGVTFVNTAGIFDVPANNTASFTLAGKVQMSNISDTTCQGAVFTVPVALSGASNS